MRTDRMLRSFLGLHLAPVHQARVGTVFAAVAALIRGGEIGLSRLGRVVAERTTVKHGIKRIDRLFGNKHLGSERHCFYRGIAHGVLRGHAHPVILVDWTEVGGGSRRVLAAATPCSGRAVLLYSEVHPLMHYANPRVEAEFLRNLRQVLPPSVRPIIVTDAGFRAPWIRQVRGMGWDYVARVRGRAYVRRLGEPWIRFEELYSLARTKAKDLGQWSVTRYKPYTARLVVIRKRRRWNPAERRHALETRIRQEVQGAREPWLLATSLRVMGATAVARLYAARMQIEETFRDTKNGRFGWAFDRACTARIERVDVMFLVAALASLLVLMVGIAAEKSGAHRAFQANTIRSRRVLALPTLGRLVLLRGASAEGRRGSDFDLPPGYAS